MKIPKRFRLYGQTIKVKFDSSINTNSMGLSSYVDNTIKLATNIKCRELLEHTYLHELLHFVLLSSKVVNKYKLDNGKNLHSDEDFIDNVSALLHQAIVTAEGKLK